MNLRNATVDARPEVARLLFGGNGDEEIEGSSGGRGGVFAIYGTGMSWVFRARGEVGKGEWILAIDRGFLGGSSSNTGSGSGSGSGSG